MENNILYQKHRFDFRAFATESFPILSEMKEKDERKSFNDLMEKLLPRVRKHLARRLKSAIKNKKIPAGKYRVADFVNQLYIDTYEHFQEVEDQEDFYIWIYVKAEKLLEETISDEAFNNYFFENIDKYKEVEWKAMQEKFSTDGDGDLMMLEEFDDPSYPDFDYTLKDVFIENDEPDLIERLNKELSGNEIHQHVNMVLHQLPNMMKTVFDLNVNHHFSPKEISRIKNISVTKVEQYLSETRKSLSISFSKKFYHERI